MPYATLPRLILALCAALAFGSSAAAQGRPDTATRPGFLAGVGLLSSENRRIDADVSGTPLAMPLTLDLPSSDRIRVAPQDIPETESDIIAGFDFLDDENRLVESLLLTRARMDVGAPLTRSFAMANLLVLNNFAALSQSYPDARLLGFGPIERDDGVPAVQMVGTFSTPEGPNIFFRHVGLMPPDSESVLIAILYIDMRLMPMRRAEHVSDTFAGWALDSLRLEEGG